MSAALHDDEPDTDVRVVRALLRDQVPRLARLPLTLLSNTGTDNAIYRLGSSYLVRLPRIAGAAQGLAREVEWLPRLRGRLSAITPELIHAGEPTEDYPYPWTVLAWLNGTDAWCARFHDGWFGSELGADLA